MAQRFSIESMTKRIGEGRDVYDADLEWLEHHTQDLRNRRGVDVVEALELVGAEAMLEYLLVDCKGEAHSNAFIDHCGMCAPRWGKLPNRDLVKPNPVRR